MGTLVSVNIQKRRGARSHSSPARILWSNTLSLASWGRPRISRSAALNLDGSQRDVKGIIKPDLL